MPSVTTFSGEVKVASRIVDYLSSGLYKSPGACLKELINNSYDADARIVHVSVKPEADSIIVEDDGAGMSRPEFESHFARVAESHKRDATDATKLGRAKIGRIGIGLIAANEIANEMEIFSTKRGSTDLLHVTINFDLMREDIDERRRGADIAKADYEGEVMQAASGEHYTRVFLNRVRGEARETLVSAEAAAQTRAKAGTLYGLTPDQVEEVLLDPSLKSWADLDKYSQTMLEIALNVPVSYPRRWLPTRHRRKASWFTRAAADTQFTVLYDGTELRKPTVLRPGADGRDLFRSFTIEGSDVSARGYMYAKRLALIPPQLNGVLLRIRKAAVGDYDRSFLGFPNTVNPLFQDWVSCEVWADDRLEDAMNIDRRTLREAHPAYVELRDRFHKELKAFLATARHDLYREPSIERRATQVTAEISKVRDAVADSRGAVRKRAVDDVVASWSDPEDESAVQRRLIRKYSVSEIYRIVIDVGRDVLSAKQFEAFLSALTERLRGEK